MKPGASRVSYFGGRAWEFGPSFTAFPIWIEIKVAITWTYDPIWGAGIVGGELIHRTIVPTQKSEFFSTKKKDMKNKCQCTPLSWKSNDIRGLWNKICHLVRILDLPHHGGPCQLMSESHSWLLTQCWQPGSRAFYVSVLNPQALVGLAPWLSSSFLPWTASTSLLNEYFSVLQGRLSSQLVAESQSACGVQGFPHIAMWHKARFRGVVSW